MAVKKRTIWLDDQDWSALNELAHGLNPSEYIRSVVRRERAMLPGPNVVRPGEGRNATDAGDERLTGPAVEQRFRETLYRDSGVSFGAPRPAPKK